LFLIFIDKMCLLFIITYSAMYSTAKTN